MEDQVKEGADLTFTVAPEEVVETKTQVPTEEEFTAKFDEPLTPEELKVAKEAKLFVPKEEVKQEEKKEEKKPEMSEEQKKILADGAEQKEVNIILDKFESDQDITAEEEGKAIKNLTDNGKGLYFRMKNERHKRQFIQKQNEWLKKEIDELKALKNSQPAKEEETTEDGEDGEGFVSRKELKKTLSEIQDKEKQKLDEDAKKKEELSKKREEEAKALKTRWDGAAQLMKTKDPENYSWVIDAGNEVMVQDKTGAYRKRLQEIAWNIDNPNMEQEVGDFLYTLAKVHPEYEELKKNKGKKPADSGKEEHRNKEDIDKIIKNSEKKTSASISGGGNRRTLTVDEITLEVAARMSGTEFYRLPKWKREELLGA